VVTRRRQAGYSLMEVLVALSVFCAFLAVLFILTAEMRGWDKRLPMNYARHPQVASLIARMRKDIADAHMPHYASPYVDEHEGFKMSEKVLILRTLVKGGEQVIVWDFRYEGEVTRYQYVGNLQTKWSAHGIPPEFSAGVGIKAVKIPGRPYGVRLQAKDGKGKLAIDQIFQPRAHN
jgi:prepilin-type N-terminal cleavage/methylation domain-containing protein